MYNKIQSVKVNYEDNIDYVDIYQEISYVDTYDGQHITVEKFKKAILRSTGEQLNVTSTGNYKTIDGRSILNLES